MDQLLRGELQISFLIVKDSLDLNIHHTGFLSVLLTKLPSSVDVFDLTEHILKNTLLDCIVELKKSKNQRKLTLLILHEDLIDQEKLYALEALDYFFPSYFRVVAGRGSKIDFDVALKISDKMEKSSYTLDILFGTIEKTTKDVGPIATTITPKTTFNLTLTESERKQRAKIKLPHMSVQEQGPQAVYIFDSEGEDEERKATLGILDDPDRDLDF